MELQEFVFGALTQPVLWIVTYGTGVVCSKVSVYPEDVGVIPAVLIRLICISAASSVALLGLFHFGINDMSFGVITTLLILWPQHEFFEKWWEYCHMRQRYEFSSE